MENLKKKPVVGGHRGHQSPVRENTVENFRLLLGKGIPYVEIDVQLTKDDQVVIFHDARLEDTTPLSGTVRQYTLAQLRGSFPINTAQECIAWCRENGMAIAFELKTGGLSPAERLLTAEKLCKLIGQYRFYDSCFVFGKDHKVLSAIKTWDPEIPLGLIPPADPEQALALMQELQAVVYLDYLEGLTQELVARLQKAGYLVDGSVVNTREGLQRALELGVDMIESDFPERILDLLETQS